MNNFDRPVIGWREWVSLPNLDIQHLKAKIDTGARTSCLHAFNVEKFQQDGISMVSFGIHPVQDNQETELFREARVTDERPVTDSGGHTEERLVIMTDIQIGGQQWPIEMTLTNRDTMKFRMLLGRTGLQDRFLVVPDASFLTGNIPDTDK
jgi:hypothetical protein